MRNWNLESNILRFWTEPMLGSCVDAAHVYSTAARDTVANQEATIQLVEISKLSWKRFQTWTSSITTCHLYILRFFFLLQHHHRNLGGLATTTKIFAISTGPTVGRSHTRVCGVASNWVHWRTARLLHSGVTTRHFSPCDYAFLRHHLFLNYRLLLFHYVWG
jgi:hypothetical protein